MLGGKRIEVANLKAKQRFKKILSEYYDENDPAWRLLPPGKAVGQFRKHNGACSCEMCRNPRRCSWTSKKNKLTVQEKRAPKIDDWE